MISVTLLDFAFALRRASAYLVGLTRREDKVVSGLEIRLVQSMGRHIVRIVSMDELHDEAITHGIGDVGGQVVAAVEIQLGCQLVTLRMPDFQMQVGWSEDMPVERIEHDTCRTIVRDLIRRRHNRAHLERPVRRANESAT